MKKKRKGPKVAVPLIIKVPSNDHHKPISRERILLGDRKNDPNDPQLAQSIKKNQSPEFASEKIPHLFGLMESGFP